jgi:hypothetical protein
VAFVFSFTLEGVEGTDAVCWVPKN